MPNQKKIIEETSKFCQIFHTLLFDSDSCADLSDEFMCLNRLAKNEKGENSSDLFNMLFEVIVVLQDSPDTELKTKIKNTFEYNKSQKIISSLTGVGGGKNKKSKTNKTKNKKINTNRPITKRKKGGTNNSDIECDIVQNLSSCLFSVSMDESEEKFSESRREEIMGKIKDCVTKTYEISPFLQYYYGHVKNPINNLMNNMDSIIKAHCEYFTTEKKLFVNKHSVLDTFIYSHLVNILKIMKNYASNNAEHSLLTKLLSAYEMYYPLGPDILSHVINIHKEYKKNKGISESFILAFDDYHKKVSKILCQYYRYVNASEEKMTTKKRKTPETSEQITTPETSEQITQKQQKQEILNKSIDAIIKYLNSFESRSYKAYCVLMRYDEKKGQSVYQKPMQLVFPQSLRDYMRENNIDLPKFRFDINEMLQSVPDHDFKSYGPQSDSDVTYQEKIKKTYLSFYSTSK